MAQKLSRRAIATYIVSQLQAGDSKVAIQQLAGYLVESRRTKELNIIVRDIQTALADAGAINGTVTTAFALSEETKKAIEAVLLQQTKAKTITLEEVINPAVLGGYKVEFPGHEIDHTVHHQLTTLKTEFKKA